MIEITQYSSLNKLINVVKTIFQGIQNWKYKVTGKIESDVNIYHRAFLFIIRQEQKNSFSEIFNYFDSENVPKKDVPSLCTKYNIFKDNDDILRVKAKFTSWNSNDEGKFPILLDQNGYLTYLIVRDYHEKICHGNLYLVISEISKTYFLPKRYSTVKKILKNCIICKRFNARPIKLNQSMYRERRISPKQVPFSEIYIDHLGPIYVKKNGIKSKVWLLCVTCIWTRGVNLLISHDLSTKEFLRNLQIHCYRYGVPSSLICDLGSQLTSGIKILEDFLKDPELISFFEYFQIDTCNFYQYFKGCSKLGALVEVIVKFTKRLLFGALKNNVLDALQFEVIIELLINLLNKRPVAFKQTLTNSYVEEIPEPIMPEMLIKSYEIMSINFFSDRLISSRKNPEWKNDTNLEQDYNKFQNVIDRIRCSYQKEFTQQLLDQSVDRHNRYSKVKHDTINVDDVVLIKEENVKPNHFPLGIVEEVIRNEFQEVTGALVRKGKNRERVKRHSSTLIPLMQLNRTGSEKIEDVRQKDVVVQRPKRAAAEIAKNKFLGQL